MRYLNSTLDTSCNVLTHVLIANSIAVFFIQYLLLPLANVFIKKQLQKVGNAKKRPLPFSRFISLISRFILLTYFHAMKEGFPKTELANTVTHGAGLLFGLVAIPFLLSKNEMVPIGAYVFSFGFLFMFVASTAYHLALSPNTKSRRQRIDHISIYFLIAGTYTPFLIGYIEPQKADFILKLLWGCVALGTVFKIFFADKFKIVSTLIYLSMGWASVFVWGDFMESMPSSILLWLGTGGACYTIGTVFYIWKKYTYHHAIWHIFVLGGAITHWYAVWLSL